MSRGCLVEGCAEKHRRNGYCMTHSSRVHRHGDPQAVHPNKKTPEERYKSLKASQKAYDKTLKGKIASRLKRHRRRAKGKVLINSKQIQKVYEQFNNKCFNCGVSEDLTLDHNLPVNLNGNLELGNIVILCRKCNGIKADTLDSEFYTKDKYEEIKKALENQGLLA